MFHDGVERPVAPRQRSGLRNAGYDPANQNKEADCATQPKDNRLRVQFVLLFVIRHWLCPLGDVALMCRVAERHEACMMSV